MRIFLKPIKIQRRLAQISIDFLTCAAQLLNVTLTVHVLFQSLPVNVSTTPKLASACSSATSVVPNAKGVRTFALSVAQKCMISASTASVPLILAVRQLVQQVQA